MDYAMMASLTCAGLLVVVEGVANVAAAGEGSRGGDTALLTVMLSLSTQIYGCIIQRDKNHS
jgi:predicted NBD/HSP70 family sugar kinase